ncbi:hypothetical protein PMIN06_001633 [Paraphaeosphaeria minitans]
MDMLFDNGWGIHGPVNDYCLPAIRYNVFFWCELNLSVGSFSLLLEHVDLVEHCLALASPNANGPSGHAVRQSGSHATSSRIRPSRDNVPVRNIVYEVSPF